MFSKRNLVIWLSLVMISAAASDLVAQDATTHDMTALKTSQQVSAERSVKQNYIRAILADEGRLWSSPLKLKKKHVTWLIPMAAVTAGLLASDNDFSQTTTSVTRSRVSDAGVVAELGFAGGLYAVGRLKDDPHARETAVLAYTAGAHSLVMAQTLNHVFQRKRPDEINRGGFFEGGSSFPSSHAAVAWSMASVFAHEYPGWPTKLLAYGTATGVSVARVNAGKHFNSDVFVGGTLGWLVGREIYRAHHDRELPGETWGTFEKHTGYLKDPMHAPSSYVPLDSWVYPVLMRAAAQGHVSTAFMGMRPWTRLQCAGIVKQIPTTLDGRSGFTGEYDSLTQEFNPELKALSGPAAPTFEIESIYSRVTDISGRPLTDSYHFGQTIVNDYGRPYGEGMNNVTGFSVRTSSTPIAIYVRGEYQHSPSLPAYSDPVSILISELDQNPVQAVGSRGTVNSFRLVEGYAAFNLRSLQFTVGKQNLWWGTAESSAMLMSSNAEPVYMARVSNMQPVRLPLISRILGPARAEFFFGELAGHRFPAAPWIHGQKLSFKPTPNLELGFSRSVIFAGDGRPLTFRSFWNSFVSVGDKLSTTPGSSSDVGDRRGGFDFSYRIPRLRKWLVLYNDAFTEDDPSPLSAPHRSGMNPGIYMPQLPKLPKLDFRAEGVYTDPPDISKYRGTFFYFNGAYHDAYTNKGNILGSWVGRQGHGLQLSSTYWFSSRKRLELVYRRAVIDDGFIPKGGKLNDLRLNSDMQLTPSITIGGSLQYERRGIPVLSATVQSNIAAAFQITYSPNWKLDFRRFVN